MELLHYLGRHNGLGKYSSRRLECAPTGGDKMTYRTATALYERQTESRMTAASLGKPFLFVPFDATVGKAAFLCAAISANRSTLHNVPGSQNKKLKKNELLTL